jgi:hypothetical protein
VRSRRRYRLPHVPQRRPRQRSHGIRERRTDLARGPPDKPARDHDLPLNRETSAEQPVPSRGDTRSTTGFAV